MKMKGLGRGLSALISEQNMTSSADSGSVTYVSNQDLEPNKYQPRKIFIESSIEELANSIAKHGIIQPIITRKIPASNKYEIIAGERRWRAAQKLGLESVPVIVKNISDSEVAEQTLIENVQREDLNPIEEANAYKELMESFNYSQEELSQAVGKNRSHVANMLRLTNLPKPVQKFIEEDLLSFGHAKVIASRDDAEELAKIIVSKGLNVRQTEHLVKTSSEKDTKTIKQVKKQVDKEFDDLSSIAESITARIGLKVTIEPSGSRGRVVLQYGSFEQLDNIIEMLSREY